MICDRNLDWSARVTKPTLSSRRGTVRLGGSQGKRHNRRGVATLWTILMIPAVLCLLALILDLGNLWLARVELANAVEAAALAGADVWGDTGNITNARNDAVTYAAQNTIVGTPVVVGANGAGTVNNTTCDGSVVILGRVNAAAPYTFDANVTPGGGELEGVRVQATVSVASVIGSLFGNILGPWNISAHATAVYAGGTPQLINVAVYNCP